MFTGDVIVPSDLSLPFPSIWIDLWPINTQGDEGRRAHIEHNTTDVADAVLEKETHLPKTSPS